MAVHEILLNEIDRQWSQAKQSEDQRSTVTNYILVIALAVQGYIVDKDFPSRALILGVIMILLGVFGALVVEKYYERFANAMTRVGRLRERLDATWPDAQLDATEAIANEKHRRRHPLFSRIRLYWFWRALMMAIAVLGIVDTYMILRYGH